MAKYLVNKRGVAKARALIDAQQYRVRSRWADVQPRAADQNAFLKAHRMGLIACYYRAAEWEHREVMVAAHKLLLHLDDSKA